MASALISTPVIPLDGIIANSLGVTAVMLVILWFFDSRRTRGRLPYPPGPPPKHFIGNMLDLPTEKETEVFEHWYRQYGDITPGGHFVILNTAQAINDLMEHRSTIYSSRPQTTMVHDLMRLPEWNFVLREYGDAWRADRRTFHLGAHLGIAPKYEPVQIRSARLFLKALNKDSSDLHKSVRRHTGSTIVDVVYGIDSNKEYLIKVADEMLSIFAQVVAPGAFFVDAVPMLKYLPRWFPGTYFHKVADRMRYVVHEMRYVPMKEIKDAFAAGKAEPSMASQLLDSGISDQDVMNIAAIAYAAGSDTSVSSLLSFFLAMATYPEVQANAQAEIDAIIGMDRLPEFADRSQLPYLNALILELWRWHPVTPFGIPHATTEDDEYEGYLIPKGSTVVGNAWSILHNPEDYPEPHEFRPERFLKRTPDDKLEIDKSVRNPAAFSFGFGRRICPGRHLADQAVFSSVASILATFSIAPVLNEHGQRVPPKVEMYGGMIAHPSPFKCDIKPRSTRAAELIDQPLPERGL